MLPEPLFHRIFDLLNKALVSNDKEIIDVQNDCGNDCAFILKQGVSSIKMWCHRSNRDHEVLKSSIPNMLGLLWGINRLSQAKYHQLRSLCRSWIVEPALILEQTKETLRWVYIDPFLQVDSQEKRCIGPFDGSRDRTGWWSRVPAKGHPSKQLVHL